MALGLPCFENYSAIPLKLRKSEELLQDLGYSDFKVQLIYPWSQRPVLQKDPIPFLISYTDYFTR